MKRGARYGASTMSQQALLAIPLNELTTIKDSINALSAHILNTFDAETFVHSVVTFAGVQSTHLVTHEWIDTAGQELSVAVDEELTSRILHLRQLVGDSLPPEENTFYAFRLFVSPTATNVYYDMESDPREQGVELGFTDIMLELALFKRSVIHWPSWFTAILKE